MAGKLFDVLGFNKFAGYFKNSRLESQAIEDQVQDNSIGVSQEEISFGNTRNTMMYGEAGGMSTVPVQFEQYFHNKASRIAKYRQMSRYPEIADALDNICDDAIVSDDNGFIVQLAMTRELPEHIEEEIRKHWKYLVYDVFDFNQFSWELFRKWVVDGELYLELILDDEGDTIIGYKVLPAHTMSPIYDGDEITGYMQTIRNETTAATAGYDYSGTTTGQQEESVEVEFDKDQIVYINYGDTGNNRLDTIGFLESSIRTYNQLKNLEDASVIYRLVRAPERRVWNVSVGRMPKAKAEEYIKKLMQQYRKKITYDSSDGSMNSYENIQAMTHDYWFAKNDDDKGTTVDTLPGGANLGEMEDVNYFLKKMYTTLKLPSSRWKNNPDGAGQFSTGKSGEVTQEEIRFARFIERLQNKFQYMLMDSFCTLLRLKGVDERYVDSSLFNIQFTQSNLFKEYKELELLESKFALLGSIESYIYKPEENENGYFDPDFVLLNWFNMSQQEYELNQKMLDSRRAANVVKQQTAGFGDDAEEDAGGFGDDGDSGGGFEPSPFADAGETGMDDTGEEDIGGGEELTSPEEPTEESFGKLSGKQV